MPEGRSGQEDSSDWDGYDSLEAAAPSCNLAHQYAARLARVQARYAALPARSLAAELARSLLHSDLHSAPARAAASAPAPSASASAPAPNALWSGKPQHYYEQLTRSDPEEYDVDSLAP